jgi:glycosyltransferase involved in cell wall biosynthesis
VAKKILQISSYPPPRAGWGVRVQFLKEYLERQGHRCVVLNIGSSRTIPSDEYETVLGAMDYVRKVWRFSRQGYVAHVHVNGKSAKGFALGIVAEILNLLWGTRCFLTFHAGVDQDYFPRPKYPHLLPMFWILFTIPKAIVCNSDAVKAKIVEYGIAPGKIVPIPAFSQQYVEETEGTLPGNLECFFRRHRECVLSYARLRREFHVDTLVEGFARVAQRRPYAGLVLCGTAGHSDPGIRAAVQAAISRLGISDRIMTIDDLPHDSFLTALRRSTVYLRTPPTDGVASSVLEALALGVPVVAAANATRPAGVVMYPAADPQALADALEHVLDRRDTVAAGLEKPALRDTLAEEAGLLTA